MVYTSFERLTCLHSLVCSEHREISHVHRLISSVDYSLYFAGEELGMQRQNDNDSAYPSLFQSEKKII